MIFFGLEPRFFQGNTRGDQWNTVKPLKVALKHFECVSNTEKIKILPKAQRTQDSYIGKNTQLMGHLLAPLTMFV